jgi:circadian clock protein KaiC
LYHYEGRPGTGKTTLALQFLLDGVRLGEPTLYITLSETERELELVAHRHGWSLDGITVFELVPPETTLDPSKELTILLATGYAELQGTQPIELPRIAKPYTRQQLSAEITRLVSQRFQ